MLTLTRVAEVDKVVLERLLQLYRYDFSPIRNYSISEHGVFTYRYLDHYFLDPLTREAYFIRIDGELAGFALCRHATEDIWEVAEFFIMQKFRKAGNGKDAARQLLGQHPGMWEVAYDVANAPAALFWENILPTLMGGNLHHEALDPPKRTYAQIVIHGVVGKDAPTQ